MRGPHFGSPQQRLGSTNVQWLLGIGDMYGLEKSGLPGRACTSRDPEVSRALAFRGVGVRFRV